MPLNILNGPSLTAYTPTFGNITSPAGLFGFTLITPKLLFIRFDFTAGTNSSTSASPYFSFPLTLPGVVSVAARQSGPTITLNSAIAKTLVAASDSSVQLRTSVDGFLPSTGIGLNTVYGSILVELA